jgi:hypothetical protein
LIILTGLALASLLKCWDVEPVLAYLVGGMEGFVEELLYVGSNKIFAHVFFQIGSLVVLCHFQEMFHLAASIPWSRTCTCKEIAQGQAQVQSKWIPI